MNNTKIQVSLNEQVEALDFLLSQLQKTSTLDEKLDFLNSLPLVQECLRHLGPIKTFLVGLSPECDYVIKSIMAIGQAPVVFNTHGLQNDKFERLTQLLKQLLEVEKFYSEIGGIIGYHKTVLKMITESSTPSKTDIQRVKYIHPEGLSLDQDIPEVRQAIRIGIEHLDQISEIYPVGGAGDRLNLTDPTTNVPLPAAMLLFLGRTLLEGLIRDVQAREYLYFKLYGKQIIIPIAMMTSAEKNNHLYILNTFNKKKWFGRPPASLFFFVQPLVPVITIEGNWSLSAPLTLTRKPGGHGVIWKLAEEQGVFDWLLAKGLTKSLIRQINNPLASTDSTLLAFIGLGFQERKAFGFVSCERLLKSAEGTNVLIETDTSCGFEYRLTNIEYTEFAKKGIGEEPTHPGSPYSMYPTNTNILFIDIQSVRHALKECPIPGQIINMKSKVTYIDPIGHVTQMEGGRLESTMQNIADYIVDSSPYRLQKKDFTHLRTFITYNQRSKTISTTKKSYKYGDSPVSTPEQAYYDILFNNAHLLKTHCQFEVPELGNLEECMKNGPGLIMLYHPALGPLYSVISQKLRKGRLAPGAELQLEIAEVDIFDIDLEGSLLIESKSPLGISDSSGLVKYGQESRCCLQHIKIKNAGINRQYPYQYWKNQIEEREAVYITLHEGSEFYAEHVVFEGNHVFEVPAYHCLTIHQETDGSIRQDLRQISYPSWQWQYAFDSQDYIRLESVYNLKR